MPDTSELIPRNGLGNKVTDVSFLLGLVDFLLPLSGEKLEPEDAAIIERIRSGKIGHS